MLATVMMRSTVTKNSWPRWGLASKAKWRYAGPLALYQALCANIDAMSNLTADLCTVERVGTVSIILALFFNSSFHVLGCHHLSELISVCFSSEAARVNLLTPVDEMMWSGVNLLFRKPFGRKQRIGRIVVAINADQAVLLDRLKQVPVWHVRFHEVLQHACRRQCWRERQLSDDSSLETN